MHFIYDFIAEQDGVTAIEYGLFAALIAVVIAGAVGSLGGVVAGEFAEVLAAI